MWLFLYFVLCKFRILENFIFQDFTHCLFPMLPNFFFFLYLAFGAQFSSFFWTPSLGQGLKDLLAMLSPPCWENFSFCFLAFIFNICFCHCNLFLLFKTLNFLSVFLSFLYFVQQWFPFSLLLVLLFSFDKLANYVILFFAVFFLWFSDRLFLLF